MIKALKEKEYTETLKENFKKMVNDVFLSNASLALLGENIVVLQPNGMTDEEFINRCQEVMHDVTYSMPDFETVSINVGGNDGWLVAMQTFCLRYVAPEFCDNGKEIPFGTLLAYRQELLDACEKGEIIAISN